MKSQNSYPLVKLPLQTDICLFLIGEELKSRKLFRALRQAGLDDCYFQPHLDSLIIHSLDLNTTDETFCVYNMIMDKRSKKIEADRESIAKQALKAYTELIQVAKKHTGNKSD